MKFFTKKSNNKISDFQLKLNNTTDKKYIHLDFLSREKEKEKSDFL